MTIQGRPRTSNIPHENEISGDIDNGTKDPDMPIITMTPEIKAATKAATTYTNISKTMVNISNTSLPSKHIRYTIILRL